LSKEKLINYCIEIFKAFCQTKQKLGLPYFIYPFLLNKFPNSSKGMDLSRSISLHLVSQARQSKDIRQILDIIERGKSKKFIQFFTRCRKVIIKSI